MKTEMKKDGLKTIAVGLLFIFVIIGVPMICSKYIDKRDLCYIHCN